MEKMNRLGNPVSVLAVMAIATSGIIAPAIAGTEITTSEGSLKLAQGSLAGQCRVAKAQIPVFKSADTTSEAVRLLAPNEQVTLADNSAKPSGFIRISAPVVGFVQTVNLLPCSSSALTSPSPTGSTATSPSPTGSTATSPSPTGSTATSQRPTGSTATSPRPTGSTATAPRPTGSTATAQSPTSSPATSPTPASSPAAAPTPASSPAAAPTPASSPTATPAPSGSTATPTNRELCRRVVKPSQGLVIRQEPTIKSPQVGMVPYQGRVTLVASPPPLRTADERDWVEISAPARGWISHSLLVETTSNLAYCL